MRKPICVFCCFVAIVMVLLAACSSEQETNQVEYVLSVKATVVDYSDQEITITYTGSLEGEQQATLYSKLAEAVDSIWVREGDPVTANQVILSLDRFGPTSSYREARSSYLNAEKHYRKMEYLFGEGAVSETDYDAARTAWEVSHANFEAVKRLIEIQTPISGIITSLDVSDGDLVNIGQKLATVAAVDRLRVKFGVNSDEISSFQVGSDVRITSDAVNSAADGEIVSVASSAATLTRTFQVEALADNSAGLFRPGMFVRISCVRERLDSVIAVSRKAVLTLDGQETMFIVSNGFAVKRPVILGVDLSGLVIVESGLAAGDTVVTLGQEYLDDGMRVNITSLNGAPR